MSEKAYAGKSDAVLYEKSLLTDDDLYLFNEGSHFRLYDKLGSHFITHKGVEGVYFAVWAPNAHRVTVMGSFNFWNNATHDLYPLSNSGIWQGFIPGLKHGTVYKYHIRSPHGQFSQDKADPFAFHTELSPRTASVVWSLDYDWGQEDWREHRKTHNALNAPMAIYEMHPGSWMRVPEENNRMLTWRELAPKLSAYIHQMGFTHVEFLPVMEHPFYGSWGYQCLGYFAPTSRFGTPDDFKFRSYCRTMGNKNICVTSRYR